jgi:hypothetical protein
MKKLTIYSLSELVKLANAAGKPVDKSKPLIFPMTVWTEVSEDKLKGLGLEIVKE